MKVRDATPDDAPAIARVHVEVWDTSYRGLIPGAAFASRSYERRQVMWVSALANRRDDQFISVVEDDEGQVAGFVACGRERDGGGRYEGEIYSIYLLAQHQGKGWGKALFLRAVEQLLAAGIASLMLWVLAENPTRRFYEALGGIAYDEKKDEFGGAILVEVAYGWDRPDLLLDAGC